MNRRGIREGGAKGDAGTDLVRGGGAKGDAGTDLVRGGGAKGDAGTDLVCLALTLALSLVPCTAHAKMNGASDKDAASTKSNGTSDRNGAARSNGKNERQLPSFYIDRNYDNKIANKVDSVVRKRFYDRKVAEGDWRAALRKQMDAIHKSTDLRQLGLNVNTAILSLNSSHCNFVTINDEMYYFLHSLFSDFNKKLGKGKCDYVGIGVGGKPFDENQIRYMLDGSPAAKGGLKIGDRILRVNGSPYVGYINFVNTSGKTIAVEIDRNGEHKTVSIKPEKADLYSAYVDAMKKSARIEEVNGKKIGYMHVWCGGRKTHEALDEIMEEKLDQTDGLIFDLRDGYGGNDLSDLDRFYRDKKAYPDFSVVHRDGKKKVFRYYYDKPMVAIINGGSRSGKELLAFSLKRTGRARLVGTRTAGAVLGGSLSPIDEKSSLYIAVFDGTIDGVRLEGTGVPPDLEVENSELNQTGYEKQLTVAKETLLKLMQPAPAVE